MSRTMPAGGPRGGTPARTAALWLYGLSLTGCGDVAPPASDWFPADWAARWTQVRDCRFSIEHDGRSITVWASPEGASAYRDGRYPLPEGTVLIKPLYADGRCGELEGFAVMRKEEGAWQWKLTDAQRRPMTPERPGSCVGCHVACTEGRDLTCTDP